MVCADYENEEVIKLAESDFPVVTIDYSFPDTYSIISDNYYGMKQLAGYILRQGHRKIAIIHGARSLVTRNRLEGFYDAMKAKGVRVPREYVIEGSYRNPVLAEELAIRLLRLEDKPTCIIAPDDQSAAGVINAIRRQGLQLVKDVSVAGYDGLESQQLIGVRLTTVKQERENIGSEASRKLIQMIEHPNDVLKDTIYMKQSLLIGNSVRRITVN